MGLFDNLKQGLKDVQNDEAKLQKLKGYADLNKDGKLDGQDVAKAKQYEASIQQIADKLKKK